MTATVDTVTDLATEPLRSRRNHWNNQVKRHAFMNPPDGAALKFLGNVTTWKQLDERSRGFAAALTRRGVQFGDRVLVVLLNRSEYVEAVMGANLIGAIPVPVNIRMSPPRSPSWSTTAVRRSSSPRPCSPPRWPMPSRRRPTRSTTSSSSADRTRRATSTTRRSSPRTPRICRRSMFPKRPSH